MGKKKIDIELIENIVHRRTTFKMRLKGLLKKIQELTVLSGTKTSLVMTDVDQNIICYSNNNDIQLVVKSTFN
jgi:SRF-type transcription factor (DNA-binding and dimerisation domain)